MRNTLLINIYLGLLFCGLCEAQIPGFIEKWQTSLDTTNSVFPVAIGRDGTTVMQSDPDGHNKYYWISPSGDQVTTIDASELLPATPFERVMVLPVLASASNLVVQAYDGSQWSPTGVFQVTQVTRSGSIIQFTKTEVQGRGIPPDGYSSFMRQVSDYSCPERLMFFQNGTTLHCYRPIVDMEVPLTSMSIDGVSAGKATIIVSSSKGGELQIEGSTDLATWRSVTNLNTTPGVQQINISAPVEPTFFYRGIHQ